MKTFSIQTDSGSMKIEAKSVNAAVAAFMGTESKVRTVAQFQRYLEKLGGHGVIEENGVIILRVR